MKYLSLLALLLLGCNHATPSALTSSSPDQAGADSLRATDTTGRTKPVQLSQQRADELFKLLLTLGVKPTKVNKEMYLSFYDLACHIEYPADIARCEFFTEPPEHRGRKEHNVRGKKEFEELRLFMSEYPVEQGDPGAVARFVQCRKYSYTKTTDCYMAIQVNYEGP